MTSGIAPIAIESPAESARRRMAASLRLLNDVLARGPLAGRHWAFGGFLLGWAREGDLMLHDSGDADFCFLADDLERLEACIPDLAAAGFELVHRFPSVQAAEPTEYSFRRDGAKFDFFRLWVEGESFRYRNYGHAPSGPVVNDCAIPAQPLEEFGFLGRSWLKVRDHDAELTALYGDWRTPCADWDYLDGPAIVATGPWDDSGYDYGTAAGALPAVAVATTGPSAPRAAASFETASSAPHAAAPPSEELA
ncbi:MAG TPA: hypothetical protein VI111_04950 [Thermoleophilaceae bacterium]